MEKIEDKTEEMLKVFNDIKNKNLWICIGGQSYTGKTLIANLIKQMIPLAKVVDPLMIDTTNRFKSLIKSNILIIDDSEQLTLDQFKILKTGV